MKKISIALAALILTVCSVSCGSKKTTEEELSSAFISAYEAHEAAENESSSTITEIIETDPFKGVSIDIPDTRNSNVEANVYPDDFIFDVQCDDSTVAPIFEHQDYDATITDYGMDSVTINVTIKEDIVSGLEEEEGIKLVPTSQDFTIDIKKYRMSLISTSQLTPKNINAICDGIKNHLIEDIDNENSWMLTSFSESIGGNNPETQGDESSPINADLTLEKCFVDDFDNNNIYFGMETAVFAIFKNKDNQYFLASSVPMFYNEEYEEQFVKYNTFKYMLKDTFGSQLYYPTLDDAINDIPENEETGKPVRELK